MPTEYVINVRKGVYIGARHDHIAMVRTEHDGIVSERAVDEVIALMQRGVEFKTKPAEDVRGAKVIVDKCSSGHTFLRTDPDNTTVNNLDNLDPF